MRVLTCLVIDACFPDHGDEDVISLPDDGDTLGGDLADDSDGNAGPGERVTRDQVFRNAQLSTKFPDFVFKKLSEGLNQLKALLLLFELVIYHVQGLSWELLTPFIIRAGRPPTL